jgi:hypothetical protein
MNFATLGAPLNRETLMGKVRPPLTSMRSGIFISHFEWVDTEETI